MDHYPNIAIIILTWNNEQDIRDCLDSVLAMDDYPHFQVIVVDNASTDNTAAIVANEYSQVTLLEQSKNLYFTGGNNVGLSYAIDTLSSEYAMILNPDTKVAKNLLQVLANKIEKDERVGAVGPQIKFWANANAGKINSAGLVYDGFMQAYDRGWMEEDKGQYDRNEEVFGVTGTCILFRTKMLREIGLFWQPLKMYLDEVELFIRARKAGWKVLYTGGTEVGHKYMQSTAQNKLLQVEKQKKRNWLLIALRHYPLKAKLAVIKKYLT